MRLERATEADLETIVRIQRASFKALYDKYKDIYNPYVEDIERIKWKLLDRPNCFYHLILLEGEIIGFLRVVTNDQQTEAWLGTAAILPAYQGQGYGYQSICLLEDLYSQVQQWDLCTVAQEAALVGFYSKCGYQPTQTKPEQEGMDMVYMTKKRKDIT